MQVYLEATLRLFEANLEIKYVKVMKKNFLNSPITFKLEVFFWNTIEHLFHLIDIELKD